MRITHEKWQGVYKDDNGSIPVKPAEEQPQSTVPHAFDGLPLNVGAGVLPLFWGALHGVTLGAWVQLAILGLALLGSVLRRTSGALPSTLGIVLQCCVVGLSVWFAVIADGLAWRRNPGKWAPEVYSKMQRMWFLIGVAALAFSWWSRAGF
jgi:hypothetical protein